MIRSGFQCRKSADIWRCAPPRHWERLVPFAEIPPERVHRDRKLGPDLIPGVVGSTQKLLKLFHVANLTPFRKRSDLSWVGTSPAASNDFAQRLDLRLYKRQLVYPQAKSHANAEVEQFQPTLQCAPARKGAHRDSDAPNPRGARCSRARWELHHSRSCSPAPHSQRGGERTPLCSPAGCYPGTGPTSSPFRCSTNAQSTKLCAHTSA